MTASKIERVALDWMAARMVREHVHKLRGEQVCAYERILVDEDSVRAGTSCWKMRQVQISLEDFQYQPYRPLAEWCEPCKKRQELHERLLKARRREGALRAALTRACRARIEAGDVIAEPVA